MIFVDTSIWVNHFARGEPALAQLLLDGLVFSHPFVVGELACGNLRRRSETIRLLSTLPQTPIAEHDEVLGMLERHRLWGRGIGWVDGHLLASARLAGVPIWTSDRILSSIAQTLRTYWAPA